MYFKEFVPSLTKEYRTLFIINSFIECNLYKTQFNIEYSWVRNDHLLPHSLVFTITFCLLYLFWIFLQWWNQKSILNSAILSIFLEEKHPKCHGGNIHILCYLLNETQLQKYQSGSENKLFQSSDVIFT